MIEFLAYLVLCALVGAVVRRWAVHVLIAGTTIIWFATGDREGEWVSVMATFLALGIASAAGGIWLGRMFSGEYAREGATSAPREPPPDQRG